MGIRDRLQEADGAAWRAWLRSAILHAYAPYLHDALVAENFDFYGRTLSGTPQQRDRWKRGVALVDQLVGEDAGRLYVERHYPPHASERMAELVGNLVEAYRRDIGEPVSYTHLDVYKRQPPRLHAPLPPRKG